MPSNVVIVTDSSACIPQDKLNSNIVVVPLDLIIGDKTYRDGIDISNQEFYRLLPALSVEPHTSGAITGPYLKAFTAAHLAGRPIICLTEPVRFTTIHQSAMLARNLLLSEYPEAKLEVMESHPAAAGLGLVVLLAAELSANGKDMDSIKEQCGSLMSKVRLMAVLDTLDYLRRSGRIPNISAIAGILGVKPMFSLDGGAAQFMGFSRSMDRAVNALIENLGKQYKTGVGLKIAVMHADNLPMANKLMHRLYAKYQDADIFITEFTPVMGAHTGPGVIGVAFYSN